MSQVIVNRNSLSFRRRQKAMTSLTIKPFLMLVTIGVFISFLSVVMLVNFNKVSTKGYTIKYLEVQNQQLLEENEVLKNNLLSQQALTSLDQTEKAKSMVKPRNVSYVSGFTALAQK